jgi:hypothetical protein
MPAKSGVVAQLLHLSRIVTAQADLDLLAHYLPSPHCAPSLLTLYSACSSVAQ